MHRKEIFFPRNLTRKSLANMGRAGTNFETPLREQNTEKMLSGAQKPLRPLPAKAFPKQQGKVDPPGAGRAAKLCKRSRRNRAAFTERKSGADLAPTVPSFLPLGVGCPREWGPRIAQGACRDPVAGAARAQPRTPRAAEALAYLPAGTRCADSSAPGPAASSWAQLRPAWSSWGQLRLEIISR